MDHQHAQVNITAFTDAKQAMLVTGTILPGGEADGSSHLPAVVILPGIAHCGYHGGGYHRTETAQLL